MIFAPTRLSGVWTIDTEAVADDRGAFVRTFCAREFADHGLEPAVAQRSTSQNRRAGTVRGMHYQAEPHAECKLVRVGRGAVYDVIVDLRPDSPTHREWLAVELSAAGGRMVYVPGGCAHGFQTLRDDTEVDYQMSAPFSPDAYRGVRHDDPAFAIDWPLPVSVISDRDRAHPDYDAPRSRTTHAADLRARQDAERRRSA